MKSALLLSLLMSASLAHDFYSDQCCSGRDCHPVSCGEIKSVADGWTWQGLLFRHDMFHDAPDGACHVCVVPAQLSPGNIPLPPHPTCIYLPSRV